MLMKHILIGAALTLLTSWASAADKPSTAGPNVHVLAPPLSIPGLDRQRTLRVYLPPSYATSNRRYPVLYMHDGQNLFDAATSYAGEWGIDENLDALARSDAFEIIVVGIDNGAEKRMNELSPWPNARFGKAEGEQYTAFLVNTVKPYIDGRYRTQPDREHTGIMGSSMGGLISHFAIHRYPETFGKAGIFSPSYWYASEVYGFTESHPLPAGARLYLLAGGKEGAQTADDMKRMVALMRGKGRKDGNNGDGKGLAIQSGVVEGGEHNEAFWRAEFPKAVRWLFGTGR